MDTKAKIAQQIVRILAGGDGNNRWDVREIMYAVDQTRDYLAKINYYERMKGGERDVDPTWLSPFENIAVVHDAAKNLWYAELPAIPISLPNNAGLNFVGLMEALFDPMIPLRNNDPWALKESGTNIVDLLGNVGYFQEGNRIYLVGQNGAANLLIKMVANSSAIGESDFYPCSPDIVTQIVDKVVSLYAQASQKAIDITDNKVPS